MEPKQCDVVILGGGIAGYTAAIRASQLGKNVVLVEKDKVGGTCLHQGCIPSKSLLHSAELYVKMQDSEAYGITARDVRLDFQRVQMRKNKIVTQLYQGLQMLMKKNKIEVIHGRGRVMGPSIFSPKSGAVAVELENDESVMVVGTHTIIATGTRPRKLDSLPEDARIMTSDEALQMDELPKSIVIVGGGVIGSEWASMLCDFGVEVTIVEYASRILPLEDEDVSREIARSFENRGIRILTDARIESERVEAGQDSLFIPVQQHSKSVQLEASAMLISVGRQGNVEGLGLENTDVQVASGLITINEHFQTGEPHIYAIGDVTGGIQLAHAAAHEGIYAAEHSAGLKGIRHRDDQIPKCIYSAPEAASVGWTEEQARQKGRKIKVSRFPMKAIGKAWIVGESEGFMKVIKDEESDDLLGIHIVGPKATELIAEGTLAMTLDATAWEVGQTIHPHPTLSEIFGEAMHLIEEKPLGI
ncbi:dihydrolipoyl dehydrogenase [Marinicrinis sediminis]|uniref:Dihydrolipoyl dehydrogenase n=1 Tax=Marinicrinis sediminis TaxID=1652465 RepID=A0ABW5RCQ8_9BACL